MAPIVEEDFPASHAMQAAVPEAYVPAGHVVAEIEHDVAPATEYAGEVHCEQEVDPARPEYVPAGQTVQYTDPGLLKYPA